MILFDRLSGNEHKAFINNVTCDVSINLTIENELFERKRKILNEYYPFYVRFFIVGRAIMV